MDKIDAKCVSSGLHDVDRLRENTLRNEELASLEVVCREYHCHGFGSRSALVKKGSIRNIKTCQFSDHSLVVQEHLETALGDLSLIGRVRSVPLGVLKHVSLDDSRKNSGVVALSLVRLVNLVEGSEIGHLLEDTTFGIKADDLLAFVRECHIWSASNGIRHGLVDQFVDRVDAKIVKDVLGLLLVVANVAIDLKMNKSK